MSTPSRWPSPTLWEQLNIKVRVDSLLFDILLDNTFIPDRLDFDQTSHDHSVFELHSIFSGAANLRIGDEEYRMTPGTLHLIGPNVFHSIKPDKDDTLIRLTVRFRYENSLLRDSAYPCNETEAEHIQAAFSRVTYIHLPDSPNNKKLNHIMEEIRTEIEKPSIGTYVNVQSLSAQLVVHLVRLIRPDGCDLKAYSFPTKLNDELRPRIIDKFFNNYKDSLTIEMLAERLHLSAKQVNRTLQQHYNTSFKQKLQDTRVEVAKELLRTSSLTIQQIAEEVGYRTAPHFNQVFMQRTGITPNQYRKMLPLSKCSKPEPSGK